MYHRELATDEGRIRRYPLPQQVLVPIVARNVFVRRDDLQFEWRIEVEDVRDYRRDL